MSLAARGRELVRRRVRTSVDCGFYVNDGRLRTEIVLPNPAVPPLDERLGRKVAMLSFFGPDGRRVRRRAVIVPRGATRVVDTGRLRGLPAFGQVQIRYLFAAGAARGGNRSIFHWYYSGGMTLVHEKREPAPPRSAPRGVPLRPGQGYMTLFGVPPQRGLELHLVVLSQDWLPAHVRLTRFTPAGDVALLDAPLVVAPRGTAFVNLHARCARPELLDGPVAVDAAAWALSYYYFVHDRRDGTWQGQHL